MSHTYIYTHSIRVIIPLRRGQTANVFRPLAASVFRARKYQSAAITNLCVSLSLARLLAFINARNSRMQRRVACSNHYFNQNRMSFSLGALYCAARRAAVFQPRRRCRVMGMPLRMNRGPLSLYYTHVARRNDIRLLNNYGRNNAVRRSLLFYAYYVLLLYTHLSLEFILTLYTL